MHKVTRIEGFLDFQKKMKVMRLDLKSFLPPAGWPSNSLNLCVWTFMYILLPSSGDMKYKFDCSGFFLFVQPIQVKSLLQHSPTYSSRGSIE